MSPGKRKAFTCLLVALSLLGLVGATFGWDYYPASYHWGFQNYSYLGFSQPMNFTEAPHQGVPYDSSLMGYWNMDEGLGNITYDSSGNGNNGSIKGATWVDGKYGTALSFGSGKKVVVPFSAGIQPTEITFSAWVYQRTVGAIDASMYLCGPYAGTYQGFSIRLGLAKLSALYGNGVNNWQVLHYDTPYSLNAWHHIVVTYKQNNKAYSYLDGVQVKTINVSALSPLTTSPIEIGTDFDGVIDDVRVYNRVLSASEVVALYTLDPVSLANYYCFTDPATNKTMLVHVDNPNANSNNVAIVTCTNFFAGNRLAFQANNSATVNVWTNLGKPAFTTGVWNGQNYTTTLALDASSTAELNWNTYNITTYVDAHSGVSPSNVTVSYGGSQTFSFNASQGYRFNVAVDGVSQGQISSYTFSNVTAPHTVNVTSTQLFTITASAGGNGSITPSGPVVLDYGQTQKFNFTANTGYHVSKVLVDNASQNIADSYTFSNVQKNHTIYVSFAINTYNITASSDSHSTVTPGTVTIDYGGNQQFNITANSGYIISHVYVDGEDQGKISSYNFTNIQSNHTISVSSAALTPTPTPSPSPSPTSTSTPSQTNPFPTETIALVAAAITIAIAVLALALKKGYITIETVDEENPEENPDDYSI